MRFGTRSFVLAACTAALAAPLAAQAASPAAGPAAPSAATTTTTTAQAPASEPGNASPWGFNFTLGAGELGGEWSDLLEKPVTGEFNFFRQTSSGKWRFGGGVAYGSYTMKNQPGYPQLEDEQEWGTLQTYLLGTRVFRADKRVRPYFQLRGGFERLHARSELFYTLPEDPDNKGKSRTEPANGFFVGVVPGVEFKLTRAAALDASFSYKYFTVDEVDLGQFPVTPGPKFPLGPVSSGSPWEARLGITWFPSGGQGSSGGVRDAWGVQRSYGWAIGEAAAINFVASITTEYIRKVNFAQISPRSWKDNIEHGFTWDDNEFKTNQWIHPFNGAAYFNSGRANGLGFWSSSAIAMAGAFQWECCGETHPISFNDQISTGIGGIALGEAQYRLSSEIFNNQASGMGRFWREFGGFLVDPVRGFNRLVSGRAMETAPNPSDPIDWRPTGSRTMVATGFRSIGEGSSITNNTQSYATILLAHTYGDVFDNSRRKPFDYIDFVGEINFGEKVGLGNVQIRGDLASWKLGDEGNHVFQAVQHFEYLNNNAYEFGGQSFGAALSSRFTLSDRYALSTRVDGTGIVLGAVNSDYSKLADVAEQERFREYDYGPGAGAMAGVSLSRDGRTLLAAGYRFTWLDVRNGSIYNRGALGLSADHYIQQAGLRLVVPVKGRLGIGADAYVFLRQSDYVLREEVTGAMRRQDISQRNPQLRVYLSFSDVR
jgi:hypothetical protein